jgi:hypothetical protein
MLHAGTISGTVKDPSGAVIVGARVEISGGELVQPILLTSDKMGKFVSPDLKPGKYLVRLTQNGFSPVENSVNLQDRFELDVTMPVAGQPTEISVSAKASAFANTDGVYRQLRNIGLGTTFRYDDFTLNLDVGTFEFRKGMLTFLSPVNGIVTGAIFIGEGHFHLKPITPMDTRELKRRAGADEMDEDFNEIVFRFSKDVHLQFLRGIKAPVDDNSRASAALSRWRNKMRHRVEVPLSFTQSILEGETMDNVDADLLAAVDNPAHPMFFNAYIRGVKHKDLRFFVRTRVGAIPQLDSPEEVALINYDPEGMDDGIWYLTHLKSELLNGTANSNEDRRLFATHHYKIETVIAKNSHLFSLAKITFTPLVEGERVLKFGLLPNLRVTRVADEQGQDLYFVQEGRREDGSFYVTLPQAAAVGQERSITVEYAGDKVLEQAGDGSFYVLARTSWYPNLNGFGEHALFDLTYKVPHRYKIISVGKLEAESTEQDFAVSRWVTSSPVAIAGFNYGDYKKLDITDGITGYKITGYYLSELPGHLRNYQALQSMAPAAMTKYALDQTRAQLQLCTYFFGRLPSDEIYITEQPDFNFGQSWPNLIYLPISAYTDSTQRWLLFGQINNNFSGFVQEVTPHEVSHQWWGHAVGWASYHDQWLSEGFAEFSAGLFLQGAVGKDWRKDYRDFWERLRRRVLDKNNFGIAPNDAGSLWMGLRLISPRSGNAYQNLVYPKGAYVLEMLRSMMYGSGDHDQEKAFIEMMHDFVQSHRDKPASTESFKAIAEKHITKAMDLHHDGRLDWFFDEWVYGTQVPRYHFDCQITPAENGKTKLHMTITQSDVDEHFAMLVPVFADFGKGWERLGQASIVGNTTRIMDAVLPTAPKKVELNVFKEILER